MYIYIYILHICSQKDRQCALPFYGGWTGELQTLNFKLSFHFIATFRN